MWDGRRSHRSRLPVTTLAAVLGVACGGEIGETRDGGAPDTSSDARSCGRYVEQGDVSSFAPVYVVPVAMPSTCSPTAIQQGVSACLPSLGASGCQAFKSQQPKCFACLFRDGGDGPFIKQVVGAMRNRGGCVELAGGGGGASGCGGRVQAVDQCEYAACSSEKLVDECADVITNGLDDPTCFDKAGSSICKTYTGLAAACGASFSACLKSDDELARVFCGPP